MKLTTDYGPWSVIVKRYMGSKLDYLGNVIVIGLLLGWSELADTCIIVFFLQLTSIRALFQNSSNLRSTKSS